MKLSKKMESLIENQSGKVAIPIIMYLLGVPGFFCLLLWFFFFRN